jgi:DNA-binding LytR/AlgR family response regulator
MLILLPFYLYFRNKFGILVTPETLNEIEFQGLNNGEKLITQKDSLVFVKASENYVKLFYTKEDIVKHATIRNTLKAIKEQAPFLIQCHRSFLVNVTQIKTVKGNSQNASIAFYHGSLSIPLSKSYYKTVKSTLSVKP